MGKVKKEVKRVGRQFERNIRKGLRSFDREVGVQAQSRELQNIGRTLVGTPKVEKAGRVSSPRTSVIRPLSATYGQTESQEAATQDLTRRRRARGIATSAAGLTGDAAVKRKTLLGG